LIEYEGDILKPVRGSSLPLKVEISTNYDSVRDVAVKKRKAFARTFNAERGYVLAYLNYFLPYFLDVVGNISSF